jgi:hypothetical protein
MLTAKRKVVIELNENEYALLLKAQDSKVSRREVLLRGIYQITGLDISQES